VAQARARVPAGGRLVRVMTAPPIFIVGSPRSGTTLLRQILDRHPALAICGETHFFPLIYLRRKAFGDLGNARNRQRLIDEYLATRHAKLIGLDTPELVERLSQEATSYKAMFTSILTYYADSQGKRRHGEKTPRHALFLDTLCEWFPNAVILHMVRDPRAAVASMQREPWAPGSVVLNARRWLKLNQAARKFRDHPGYLEVRYEDLVMAPAGELRKICSFLGEEYAPSILVPREDLTTVGEHMRRSQTAITSSRLELWRKELTAAQIAQIEWVSGPILETFGYERGASQASALIVLRGVSRAAFEAARFVAARLPSFWYSFGTPAKIAKYDDWTGPRTWRKDPKGPSREGA
jgi:hypothetical protein